MGQLFRHLAALALLGLLAAPGAALADGGRSYGDHDWRNYRQPSHYQTYKGYKGPYGSELYRGAGRFKGGSLYGAPRYGDPKHGRVYSLVPPWPGYGCRPVVVVDRYRGGKVKGSGSLCYDSLGRTYFLPGSGHSGGFRY